MLFLIDNNDYIMHDLYKLKSPLTRENYDEEFQLSPIMHEQLTRDYLINNISSGKVTVKDGGSSSRLN